MDGSRRDESGKISERINVLGIESSGTTASAAVLSGRHVRASFSTDTSFTHSTTLMPLIDSGLKASGFTINDIDLIAVSAGPGSFTGLRIGAGTAKGLALAAGCAVICVPTLLSLAFRIPFADGIICPVMDARRGRVYTASYTYDHSEKSDGTGLLNVLPEEAVDIHELFEKLYKYGKKVIFTGDAADSMRDVIINDFKGEFLFPPDSILRQSASSVAELGRILYEEGYPSGIHDLKLHYMGRPGARTLAERGK